MKSHKFALMGVTAAALLAMPAMGQTWTEDGDAPDSLPGQITNGSGPLTMIEGTTNSDGDIDLYCINIVDAANFRASTVDLATIDTQLFLFDENGVGIAMNDDHVGGSTLQSEITSQFIPGNGRYIIGVTTYDNDPQAGGLDLWLDSPFRSERQPDGPGAPGPFDGWDIRFGTAGSYGISLSGAEYCEGGNSYRMSIEGTCPGNVRVSWSGAGAGQQGLVIGNSLGSTTIPGTQPCAGTVLGIQGGVMLVDPPGIFGTNGGSGAISGRAGAGACGRYLQLVKGGTCDTSNVVQIP